MREWEWRRIRAFSLATAWAAIVASGFAALYRHAGEPGDPGTPPLVRPTGSRLLPSTDLDHLVMFAHPRCPCSAAGVSELARPVTSCDGRILVDVVFFRPEGSPDSWGRTSLRRAAEAIPGVRAVDDVGGREAALFGVVASGHVLLFDPCGRRLFSGGITVARGHEGRNDGSDAVIRLVNRAGPSASTHPVFGCAIRVLGGPA
ncbi:RedB protein [Paludisphaera soli]|uniref:RedB protein n=1 Tax=Paludisphaera soli TaxID=2712865 RepID=UPI0013ED45FC|nr:RedB protein [Paludisphaera soli]